MHIFLLYYNRVVMSKQVITFEIDGNETKANVLKHLDDGVIPWPKLTKSIILKPLGKDTKGTYGQVYKITNLENFFDENVVVKVITANNIGDFSQEFLVGDMMIDGVLKNAEYLTKIYAYGILGETNNECSKLITNPIKKINCNKGKDCKAFLMMEKAESDLLDIIERINEPEIILTLYYHIILGLEKMHNNGIVNTDLKPENVLVFKDKLKLTDYGTNNIHVDKINQGCKTLDEFRGTPEYIPPEVIAGKPWSPAGDIWSMGCLFYVMVANKILIEGRKTDYAKKIKHNKTYKEYYNAKKSKLEAAVAEEELKQKIKNLEIEKIIFHQIKNKKYIQYRIESFDELIKNNDKKQACKEFLAKVLKQTREDRPQNATKLRERFEEYFSYIFDNGKLIYRVKYDKDKDELELVPEETKRELVESHSSSSNPSPNIYERKINVKYKSEKKEITLTEISTIDRLKTRVKELFNNLKDTDDNDINFMSSEKILNNEHIKILTPGKEIEVILTETVEEPKKGKEPKKGGKSFTMNIDEIFKEDPKLDKTFLTQIEGVTSVKSIKYKTDKKLYSLVLQIDNYENKNRIYNEVFKKIILQDDEYLLKIKDTNNGEIKLYIMNKAYPKEKYLETFDIGSKLIDTDTAGKTRWDISDAYLDITELGSGTFGSVYKINEFNKITNTGFKDFIEKKVVLKFVESRFTSDDGRIHSNPGYTAYEGGGEDDAYISAFINESKIYKNVVEKLSDHENIGKIYEYGLINKFDKDNKCKKKYKDGSIDINLDECEDEDSIKDCELYIFMEKGTIDLESYYNIIYNEDKTNLSKRKITYNQDIYMGLLNGLKKIHESKIIHRDIRPPNIMISMTNEGELINDITDLNENTKVIAKYIDWGVSYHVENPCDRGLVAPMYLLNTSNDFYYKQYKLDIHALGLNFLILLLGIRSKKGKIPRYDLTNDFSGSNWFINYHIRYNKNNYIDTLIQMKTEEIIEFKNFSPDSANGEWVKFKDIIIDQMLRPQPDTLDNIIKKIKEKDIDFTKLPGYQVSQVSQVEEKIPSEKIDITLDIIVYILKKHFKLPTTKTKSDISAKAENALKIYINKDNGFCVQSQETCDRGSEELSCVVFFLKVHFRLEIYDKDKRIKVKANDLWDKYFTKK